MEDVPHSTDGEPDDESAPEDTDEKVVPEGPKTPCPNCGSTKLRTITKEDEIARFYQDHKVRVPMLTLSHPKECKSCGHRWEVMPSKFMLRLAIFVFGLGFLLGACGAGLAIKAAIYSWGQAPVNDILKTLGFAVALLGLGSGCGYGVSYNLAKLRKRAAKKEGAE